MRPASRVLTQRVDGLGEAQIVRLDATALLSFSVSPDGKHAAFSTGHPGLHVFAMASLTDGRTLATYGALADDSLQTVFSPDGRWLTSSARRNGNYEVCVAPSDSLALGVQISDDGGNAPMWSGDPLLLLGHAQESRVAGSGPHHRGAAT